MTAIPATLRLRREGVLRSRAARGDAVAFAAVYERHHQALYRYCRSILRHEEDAQDALQSTMAQAFAALQHERRDFELRPWLFRIAHNEAISILRRRRATDELSDVPDERPFEDTIAEREELRLLQMDLADLPERQRAALVLRELNGLSHAEIGIVLELSPTAVKQAIFEARSALFSCREGREMDCQAVRRILSDGDGRVLRGRGLRAHLRSCSGCRRFRADLEQRPRALKALVPPLPVGTAAALFAELVGAGTAAKLLACIAIAGGGATLAAEMRDARQARPPVVADAPAKASATLQPDRGPRQPPPAVVPPVATSELQPAAETETAPPTASAPRARAQDRARELPERARTRGTRTASDRPVTGATADPTATPAPARTAEPEQQAKPEKAKPRKPQPPAEKEKPAKPEKPTKPQKPVKKEHPAKPEKPVEREHPARPEKPAKPENPADTEKSRPASPAPTVTASPVPTPLGALRRPEDPGKSEDAASRGNADARANGKAHDDD